MHYIKSLIFLCLLPLFYTLLDCSDIKIDKEFFGGFDAPGVTEANTKERILDLMITKDGDADTPDDVESDPSGTSDRNSDEKTPDPQISKDTNSKDSGSDIFENTEINIEIAFYTEEGEYEKTQSGENVSQETVRDVSDSNATCSRYEKLCTQNVIQVCVKYLESREHCGECGNKCDRNVRCISGKCGHGSPCLYTICDWACIDTRVDPNHCGRCNNPCSTKESCFYGKCTPWP